MQVTGRIANDAHLVFGVTVAEPADLVQLSTVLCMDCDGVTVCVLSLVAAPGCDDVLIACRTAANQQAVSATPVKCCIVHVYAVYMFDEEGPLSCSP